MTREEAEDYANNMTYRDAINNLMKARSIPYRKATFIKVNELLKALEQEPCDDAQERYEDLCEYFGGAKDILKSRKDFKAWLERIKWHIHKAEELYEKYEHNDHDGCKDCRWQSQSETEMPCKQCMHNYTDEWERAKIGHWIWQTEDIYQCSECGENIHVKEVMNKPQYAWCPICGRPMEIER